MTDKEWMEWLEKSLVPVKKLEEIPGKKRKAWIITHWELNEGAYTLLRELYDEGKL